MYNIHTVGKRHDVLCATWYTLLGSSGLSLLRMSARMSSKTATWRSCSLRMCMCLWVSFGVLSCYHVWVRVHTYAFITSQWAGIFAWETVERFCGNQFARTTAKWSSFQAEENQTLFFKINIAPRYQTYHDETEDAWMQGIACYSLWACACDSHDETPWLSPPLWTWHNGQKSAGSKCCCESIEISIFNNAGCWCVWKESWLELVTENVRVTGLPSGPVIRRRTSASGMFDTLRVSTNSRRSSGRTCTSTRPWCHGTEMYMIVERGDFLHST